MFLKLKSIKNLGIFENFQASNQLNQFSRYNLIYGWNGSGKTTLGRLFRNIEFKTSKKYPDASFKLQTDSGDIDQSYELDPVVRVFNHDFVSENMSLEDAETKSILYIGKSNAELRTRIKEIEEELTSEHGVLNELRTLTDREKELSRGLDSFHKECGDDLRELHALTVFSKETNSLDKRTSNRIWDSIVKDQLGDYVLSSSSYQDKKNFITRGKQKPAVNNLSDKKLDPDLFQNQLSQVKELLATNVVNKTIDKLNENGDLLSWVRQGWNIHDNGENRVCEFCTNHISDQRTQELKDHFNDGFLNLQNSIWQKINELNSLKVEVSKVDKKLLYDVPQDFDENLINWEESCKEINGMLEAWGHILHQKKDNPTTHNLAVESIDESALKKYNDCANILASAVESHNEKVDKEQEHQQEARKKLDNHIVASKGQDKKIIELELSLKECNERIEELGKKRDRLLQEKSNKEGQILDDLVALDRINSDIQKLLTNPSFELKKNESGEGGYVIKRAGNIAHNLSEGEKTAISLVFFVAKLREQNSILENTIVVFDDPISSFDSNHLFSAFSFIKNQCSEAKQLFILTHNFWFFKLFRDWFLKKNKKHRESSVLPAKMYTLNLGNIKNISQELEKYNSEYHYLFSVLKGIKSQESVSLKDSYMIANFCRKVLESFNAFKYGGTGEFMRILEKAVNKEKISPEKRDKIFQFLNKYSHLDRIESLEYTIENIEGEGKSVIEDVFGLIESLDQDHYTSMMKAVG